MKKGIKCVAALMFGFYALRGVSAERLRGMSDETAAVASQPEPATDHRGEIIYRVICSPEGEMLPECGQPPVKDRFEAAQPGPVEPEKAETPNEQPQQADSDELPVGLTKSVPAKKAATSKKRAKKSGKKPPKRPRIRPPNR